MTTEHTVVFVLARFSKPLVLQVYVSCTTLQYENSTLKSNIPFGIFNQHWLPGVQLRFSSQESTWSNCAFHHSLALTMRLGESVPSILR